MTDGRTSPSSLGFCCSFSSADSDHDAYELREPKLAVEHKRPKRQGSCFSRAARRIRAALPRIYRRNFTFPPVDVDSPRDLPYETCDGCVQDKRGNEAVLGAPISTSSSEEGSDYDDCYKPLCHNEQASSSSSITFLCASSDSWFPPKTRHNEKGRLQEDACASFLDIANPKFPVLYPPNKMDTSDGDPSSSMCAQSKAPLSAGLEDDFFSVQSDDQVDIEECVSAVSYSATSTQPAPQLQRWSSDPGWSRRGCSSSPSLSQMTSEPDKLPRAVSSPDMRLKSSFEEFTPDISADDETYRFLCSCPGLYQCSVTGLVFNMEGEGDVVYRVVTWNRRLLAQHHKKPAGPLFDIKCVQQSVCQLHLPHCEISSTGGAHFLSVAHVSDEGIEFIRPQKINETHVVINITGFSGFGNVKDEDSPPDAVRALVLLFYRPPNDPDLEYLINVLLLPKNISLRDVVRTRKKLVGDERYIETSPHCKLQPEQVYTLSTCPEGDSVLVQPTEAEFDSDNYDNYFPSFQVTWETAMKHMKLFLRDSSSHSVWERRVCLSSTAVKNSCGSTPLNLPPNQRLLNIRSCFIDGISAPVLQTLLDKLLQKRVITDSEREAADVEKTRRDKAGFVIDTVRRKGDAASSEMIEILCEVDTFLCEHLELN